MDHGAASISPLVASCAVTPSVGAGMILFNNTFFSQKMGTSTEPAI